MSGYVIEYGKAQKVFVEEGLYISALECLKSLGQRVQVAQWVDHLDDKEVSVLDAKSFGYIIECSANNGHDDVKRVFAPADELESITARLYNEGHKPMLSRWTNCILNPAVDGFTNITASACTALCDNLTEIIAAYAQCK